MWIETLIRNIPLTNKLIWNDKYRGSTKVLLSSGIQPPS